MNKRKLFITLGILVVIIVIITPIGFIHVLNNGNPYTKYIANKYVPKYIEEKGYTEDSIKDLVYVEPKHLINKDFYHGHYMVIFEDEPNTTYYYGVTKKGKQVKQFCEKDIGGSHSINHLDVSKGKHSESSCVNSLDNRD